MSLPFGTALDSESTGSTKRRFTSYDRSSVTGLDYANNRHYDSQQGRFTQVDPIGMGSVSPESPQTLNLYAYCINDPINQIDPSGLGFFSFVGKLFKAIGKVFKIITIILIVVVVTALVIAYFAPAGSAWIGFAKFLLFKVAPVLAGIVGGSGSELGVKIRPVGTPPWNPNGGGGIGVFGWDDTVDVITTTTNCRNSWPAPDGPNCPGAPWYKKVWHKVLGGIAVTIALGMVAYERISSTEQRFGLWFLDRMDKGTPKIQIGTYSNGDPIYMGFAVTGTTSRTSGLTTPRSFFGNLTAQEAETALENRFGPPIYSEPGAKAFFNARTGRSFLVHNDPAHGAPHVDIVRRGRFPRRKYPLR